MDLLKRVAEQFLKGSGQSGLDVSQVIDALQGLLGEGGIGELVSKLQGGGLAGLVGSWLGDGANSPLSVDQLSAIFGDGELSSFASQLGIDRPSAERGLAEALPTLIDKASSGGSLLEAAGGAGGLLGAAKGLFGS